MSNCPFFFLPVFQFYTVRRFICSSTHSALWTRDFVYSTSADEKLRTQERGNTWKTEKKIQSKAVTFSFLNVVNRVDLRKNEIGKACRKREEVINAYKIEVEIF